ncbi:MAG: NnrS family protein [Gammaproteobacteria bacterium]|nr:NnrS family protein [Gammaproteobacteria bacterium]
MTNIETKQHHPIALHHLGFRPFFLLGSLFALVSIALWTLQYHFSIAIPAIPQYPAVVWHGHEMVFGYAMAVVGGFLLTAARNWTNVQTLHGAPLLILAGTWLLARLCAFIDSAYAMQAMILLDIGFDFLLFLSILYPIVKVRQWSQLGICLLVLLIGLSNLLFYSGLTGYTIAGIESGLKAGLYLIVILILLMGRRVIPFFIEKGVDEPVKQKNYLWLDNVVIVLAIAFVIFQVFAFQVFIGAKHIASLLAIVLVLLHSWRLRLWHTPGIWKKPLLWVLYIAYGFIVIGFLLVALANQGYISPALTTHAFAYGGIGLMTIGMAARVALGHTGRNVFQPPGILFWVFLAAAIGAVVRVFLPLVRPDMISVWIGLSQGCWMLAFGVFSWVYVPMLVKGRVDGRYG